MRGGGEELVKLDKSESRRKGQLGELSGYNGDHITRGVALEIYCYIETRENG